MLGTKAWLRTVAASALALACGGEEPAAKHGAAAPESTSAIAAAREATAARPSAIDVAPDAATAAPGDAVNRPPVLLAVEIDDRDSARSDRDLTAKPNAEDPDGDALAFEYRWTVNDRTVDDAGDVLPHTRFERGDRIGLSVRAADTEDSSDWWRASPFEVGNAAPRITSIPGDFDPDGTFRYRIVVDDVDGDRGHRYQILKGPEGMKIDPVTATLFWTPGAGQEGVHPVQISVRDRHDGVAIQDFDVRVAFEEFEVPAAPLP